MYLCYLISNNHASECLGVGVRIGGWEVDGHEYGRDNNVSKSTTAHTKYV